MKKVVSVLRLVVKYAGLVFIIVDVVTYAADKIEGYLNGKEESAKNGESNIQ